MTPKSIALFEKIAYIGFALQTLLFAIDWPITIQMPGANPAMFVEMQVIYMALEILFIWLIAHKRKNWARWVWIVASLGCTALAVVVEFIHPLKQNGVTGAAAFYLAYLASVVSAYFLLTREAGAWFRSSQP